MRLYTWARLLCIQMVMQNAQESFNTDRMISCSRSLGSWNFFLKLFKKFDIVPRAPIISPITLTSWSIIPNRPCNQHIVGVYLPFFSSSTCSGCSWLFSKRDCWVKNRCLFGLEVNYQYVNTPIWAILCRARHFFVNLKLILGTESIRNHGSN